MRVRCVVSDLLLLSWEIPLEALADLLPAGLAPSETPSGAGLVSLAAARVTEVRVGPLPIPGWKHLAVRTYVEGAEGPGVFFLALRAGGAGLAAAAAGVPVRPARARVQRGLVRAPGLGVYAAYRLPGGEPHVPELECGPLGGHERAYVYSAGLRRLEAAHAPFAFEPVELTAPLRLDPLLALGLDVGEPASALYAARTAFSLERPVPAAGSA